MLPRVFCLVSSVDDLTLLPALVSAGVDGFQVRDKTADGRALLALTRRVMDSGVPVVVNDRFDVALAAGAYGVHLGASDLPVAEARRIAPGLAIGATCRDRASVERAARDGATYAGFGPLFATTSKAGLPDPIGPAALASATGPLPLIGIGGVTAATAASVVAAGAHGIAVIGGVWGGADPVAAASRLSEAIR